MRDRAALETMLQHAEVPAHCWPGLLDAIEVWHANGQAEPAWCDHIEWDEVGRGSGWWFLVPFNDIRPVPPAWRVCPICSTPRSR